MLFSKYFRGLDSELNSVVFLKVNSQKRKKKERKNKTLLLTRLTETSANQCSIVLWIYACKILANSGKINIEWLIFS